MIILFKKIRHKLLTEKQLWKYILYAAGKITLVTIGILITLQIRFWEESKKAQANFEGYIEQLKVDVESAIKNSVNGAKTVF